MRRALALAVLALSLSACAWSNRANRPVWNAFEAHVVPTDEVPFYASLPLTVPAGLVVILVDTFIAHPIQVADDAWGDAADLWTDVPWAGEYYSQLALLPFRAVVTPLVLLGSFLGRSCFDIPPRGSAPVPSEEAGPDGQAARPGEPPDEARREAELLAAFGRVAAGATHASELAFDLPAPATWSEALQAGFERALATGRARGRLALLLYVRRHDLPPVRADAALGLRDPEAIVRYEVLCTLGPDAPVPAALRAALREDPDEVVAALARDLWP